MIFFLLRLNYSHNPSFHSFSVNFRDWIVGENCVWLCKNAQQRRLGHVLATNLHNKMPRDHGGKKYTTGSKGGRKSKLVSFLRFALKNCCRKVLV